MKNNISIETVKSDYMQMSSAGRINLGASLSTGSVQCRTTDQSLKMKVLSIFVFLCLAYRTFGRANDNHANRNGYLVRMLGKRIQEENDYCMTPIKHFEQLGRKLAHLVYNYQPEFALDEISNVAAETCHTGLLILEYKLDCFDENTQRLLESLQNAVNYVCKEQFQAFIASVPCVAPEFNSTRHQCLQICDPNGDIPNDHDTQCILINCYIQCELRSCADNCDEHVKHLYNTLAHLMKPAMEAACSHLTMKPKQPNQRRRANHKKH